MGTPSTLDAAREEEIRTAARALLRSRVVRADGEQAADYHLIRRHAATLRDWFQRNPGYRLVVDSAFAHLDRPPLRDPAGRPVTPQTRSGTPFDRRRYGWMFLILAIVGETSDRHTTLGALAEEVVDLADAHGLPAPDLDLVTDRQALADAVRHLCTLGAVRRKDGTEQDFVTNEGAADALYEVDPRLAAQLLVTPRPPSAVASVDAMDAEVEIDTEQARQRRVRNRVWRRILEDPVVHYEDIDPAEREYIVGQRGVFLAPELERMTGLHLEGRREGVAGIEPEAGAAFPVQGTVGAAALAVATECGYRASLGHAGEPIPREELAPRLRRILDDPRCAQRYATAGGPAALLDDSLVLLAGLGLVALDGDHVRPRPAIARYTLSLPPAPGDAEP